VKTYDDAIAVLEQQRENPKTTPLGQACLSYALLILRRGQPADQTSTNPPTR
jgi:hypothetical protein